MIRENNDREQTGENRERKKMTPGTASVLDDFPVSVPQEAWATPFLSWFP